VSQARRRAFLFATGALLSAPLAAFLEAAQRRARVGMLLATRPEVTQHLRGAFTERLAQLGWREGTNIEYTVRYALGEPANWDPLAAEMVARKPDVIFVGFGPFAAVVKKHTRDIPIVFSISQDPVGEGVVASLARPGGNATGTSTRNNELIGKRLQLLKEVLPSASRIGIVRRVGLIDSSEIALMLEDLERTAAQLRLHLIKVEHPYGRAGEFGPAFAELLRNRVDAVATVINWNYLHLREFMQHAMRARLPTICDATEFADAGGLISLSIDRAERYRKSAEYVNRILRGAKPSDLPVDEATVFEFVINLKTARALALRIPQPILQRADRIIE
jgi:putative tryptophan/tyrosine transport system substrate-binding protein